MKSKWSEHGLNSLGILVHLHLRSKSSSNVDVITIGLGNIGYWMPFDSEGFLSTVNFIHFNKTSNSNLLIK